MSHQSYDEEDSLEEDCDDEDPSIECNRDASRDEKTITNEGDVTKEELEKDSDCELIGFASEAYLDGDAHVESSLDQEVNLQTVEVRDDTELDDRSDSLEDAQPDQEEIIEDSIDEDAEHIHSANNKFSFSFQHDELAEKQTEEQRVQEEETHNVETNTDVTETAARPIPAPRTPRPTRERKPPDRFDDYVMYRMANRQVDSRVQALDTLVRSGVLSELDSLTAHKSIQAVMKLFYMFCMLPLYSLYHMVLFKYTCFNMPVFVFIDL